MDNATDEFDFELNLLFEGQKNPVEAFGRIAKMYDRLLTIDQQVLYNILPSAKIEYELIGIEYGSIKSKVNQILKAIPDELLKDITDPRKLIGYLLVFIKHRLIKATETNEIQSKSNLDKVTNEINGEITKYSSSITFILEVNKYFILNAVNDLGTEGRKLKNSEAYEFKSKRGNATIRNNCSINMPKILKELGENIIVQQRTEILKVKTLDLLSDKASWRLIRQGKQIEVKILDQEWLDDYHNREISIQPNDSLKVELKITYTSNSQRSRPLIKYEALKIIEVIPPNGDEENDQTNLFPTE